MPTTTPAPHTRQWPAGSGCRAGCPGSNAVNVDDVVGLGKAEVVDNHEEGGEEGIPDVEGNEQDGREDTGAQDGTVRHEVVWEERHRGDVLLVKGESDGNRL